jgi:hypothetical protein
MPTMKTARYRTLHHPVLAFFIAAILAACNSPAPEATSLPVNVTQAYQTVEARLTEGASQNTSYVPELTPSQTPSIVPNTPAFTPTNPRPSVTPSPEMVEPCDRAAPGYPRIDVEIDDDTEMQPGQRFTKIWRLFNSGTCTWTREYKAVWFFGSRLGDSLSMPLGVDVAPGESIDIMVDMVAPQTPGSYQSNWKLQNLDGDLFGIGPSGNSPFWVRIIVVQPATPTPSPTTPAPPTETPTATPTITETASPTPIIIVSSETILKVGDSIDLFSGTVNPPAGSDLFLQEDAGSTNWLAPSNGAVLGIYGAGEPSYQICRNANMSVAPIAVGSLSPGAYLCYRTSEGYNGWLRLNGVDAESKDISITILTWEIMNE